MALILWHLLDRSGDIVRSVHAPDKREATAKLGPGFVISDASYRMDRRYVPPAAVPYEDVTKPITVRRAYAATIPDDHASSMDVAEMLGISRNLVVSYAKTLRLQPVRIYDTRHGRDMLYWSPKAVREMASYHQYKQPSARFRHPPRVAGRNA